MVSYGNLLNHQTRTQIDIFSSRSHYITGTRKATPPTSRPGTGADQEAGGSEVAVFRSSRLHLAGSFLE